MHKRTQAGFTLYELLITVLVVGVVLALSVPNLQAFTQNSRITGAANDLHSALHLARSESSRAKTNITVCASADGNNCGGAWEQGFIVFADMEPDLNRAGADETILRVHGALDDSLTLAVADDATYFTYSSAGLGRPNVGGNAAVSQIVVCDERGSATAAGGSSAARLLVATPLGRATIFRDKKLVDDALGEMGKTCP
ncbi:MAG: GspH/FimT family pseudopilin [Proteobacteria bacterium]|nr:GspH/FimT family pseudopilin [Pseudomonadota bacterium]